MNHEDDGKYEPTRFAFFRDGELVAGTLGQWANMWEGDYYAGDTDLSTKIWTWDNGVDSDPVERRITEHRGNLDEDYMIPCLFTIPGLHDVASVSIDGRN